MACGRPAATSTTINPVRSRRRIGTRRRTTTAVSSAAVLVLLLCQGIHTATGYDPGEFIESGVPSAQSIELLGALGKYNTSWAGVTLVLDPFRAKQVRPAYYLEGDYRDLKLPPAAFLRVARLLTQTPSLTAGPAPFPRSPTAPVIDFTIAAYVRQTSGNAGTILSITPALRTATSTTDTSDYASTVSAARYLELQSSRRRNEIRLHYTSRRDGTVHVETFAYQLADDMWYHVLVGVSGGEVTLMVNCKQVYKRLLGGGPPAMNLTGGYQLWLGQRDRHYHFKGSLYGVELIAGSHGYLIPCKHQQQDAGCPTCGQFALLQSTVQDLTRHLQQLSQRLVAAEARVDRLEQCDCQQSCRVNGTMKSDGATWQQGCEKCACVHGEVKCRPVECPVRVCKNPINKTGECCPICLKNCLMHGVFYDHGDVVSVKQCVECECLDGNMKCKRIDAKAVCPKLTCPPEKQFSVHGECCKFCPDVDECQQEGDLQGHHCHSNTRCVNTPGGYRCECLAGYRRVDKYNCAEFDECSEGLPHPCHENAHCMNTLGSFRCVCKMGYTGDGYNCTAMCRNSCLNGGNCHSPDVCVCPHGYTGASCEWDLDECATSTHRCTVPSSECVNMVGWYYCRCKDGFHSALTDNNLGTLCEDVDECKNKSHSCHPTARCNNTVGSFQCLCPPGDPNCRRSCMLEDKEVVNGETVTHPANPCQLCTCHLGVLTCLNRTCNCSTNTTLNNDPCCPQCNPSLACTHQELTHVRLPHGELWSYQCQTCECLRGEIDCWPLVCPPIYATCVRTVRGPNDCCTRCLGGGHRVRSVDRLVGRDLVRGEENSSEVLSGYEPCGGGGESGEMVAVGNSEGVVVNSEGVVVAGRGAAMCPYHGQVFESGATFADPGDPCVKCSCKDGILCCSFNILCDDLVAPSRQPVGFDGVPMVAPTTLSTTTTTTTLAEDRHRTGVRLAAYSGGGGVLPSGGATSGGRQSGRIAPSRTTSAAPATVPVASVDATTPPQEEETASTEAEETTTRLVSRNPPPPN